MMIHWQRIELLTREWLREVPSYLLTAFAGIGTLLVGHALYAVKTHPQVGASLLLAMLAVGAVVGLYVLMRSWPKEDEISPLVASRAMAMSSLQYAFATDLLELNSTLNLSEQIHRKLYRPSTDSSQLSWLNQYVPDGYVVMLVPKALAEDVERLIAQHIAEP